MGIQGFFGYFLKENNNLKEKNKFINFASVDDAVHRLYVDFISIVHDILAENKHLDDGQIESNQKIANKIIERLEQMFSYYPNAQKLVFFESIPTVAKIKEQYSRRIFKKIQSSIDTNLSERLKCKQMSRFDQQNFAIDSEFIKDLTKTIANHFINDAVNIFSLDSNLDNNIGEAEHQIIKHIKNNTFGTNNKFVIYSPDADVFLLSTILTNILSTKNKKIIIDTLRRSDNVEDRDFYKIDTIKYIQFLKNTVGYVAKPTKDLINDITYIFNLLGDDFIPIFDKFKTVQPKKIFPAIFSAMKKLNENKLLEIANNSDNKFTINKTNLLKIFEEINLIDVRNKKFERDFKYVVEKEKIFVNSNPIPYNELVFMILTNAFNNGYYFVEQSTKSNPNNFFVTADNYNRPFTEIITNHKQFLQYKIKDDTYMFTICNKYKVISLVELDNKTKHYKPHKSDAKMILNYFEGYQFILDMYFNTPGIVKNNFWYYKYNKSPNIDQTIKWLKSNELPSTYYNNNHNNADKKYFTIDQYKTYLQMLIDSNYSRLLKPGNDMIEYDDLIKFTKKKKHVNGIFDCYEKKYINKCEIKNEIFVDPILFIKKNKQFGQKGGSIIKNNTYYQNKYKKYNTKNKILLTIIGLVY